MKKETIAAIIFGIVMGTVLGILLLTKNKQDQLNKTKTIAPTVAINKEIKTMPLNTQVLELSAPEDKEIVYKNSVAIKGMVTKNSLVIIQSPVKDLVGNNTNGKLEENFPLALGENVIRISVYPNDKKLHEQEKELRVYYFPEQL